MAPGSHVRGRGAPHLPVPQIRKRISRICVYSLPYLEANSISGTITVDVGTLRTKVEIYMPPLQFDLSLDLALVSYGVSLINALVRVV